LQADIKDLNEEELQHQFYEAFDDGYHYAKDLIFAYVFDDIVSGKQDILEYFQKQMEPKINKFELLKYKKFTKIKNEGPKEIWTSDDCLLVLDTIYQMKIKPKIL